MWQQPKTDWAPSDVYNIHIDLSRVEQNLHELARVLRQQGYEILILERLYWKMTDFPTVSEINRIRQNINTVVDRLSQLPGVPRLIEDNSGYFDYESANDLERNIEGLKRVLDGALLLYRYCGTTQCGEEYAI